MYKVNILVRIYSKNKVVRSTNLATSFMQLCKLNSSPTSA